MNEPLYIAVDLGAGSGRVFLAGVTPGEFLLEEAHRFHYPPSRFEGHLRWNFRDIFNEIKTGARLAVERGRELNRIVQSIGVDSWAVDYGLIDGDGNLVEHPVCYRDERTRAVMEAVFAQRPREEIFERTGIQFQAFNTLFQLYAHVQEGMNGAASRLLLIPDLVNFFLTGEAVTEYTNATTTQLVNAKSGTWDREMMEPLGLPSGLLTDIVSAGTDLGPVKASIADELQTESLRVIAPATHDTASAVAGAPLKIGWAYISSGTWSLVGVERDGARINADVARHNFTNEGGAFGTIRFLKNVMGLWVLESCRREWKWRGFELDYDVLLYKVETIKGSGALIFPDDPRFFNPPSMLDAIAQQLAETGRGMPDDPIDVTKMILDSLAFRYKSVLRAIESVTNQKINGVQIIGGGSRNNYLNQATATVTGKPVLAGPVEATVTGNVLVQAIATGRFVSLMEAREYVAQHAELGKFYPRPSPAWEEAARRYEEIEAQFSRCEL